MKEALALLERKEARASRVRDTAASSVSESSDSDDEKKPAKKKARSEKITDELLLAIAKLLGREAAELAVIPMAWHEHELLLTPRLWFRGWNVLKVVWNVDIVEGSTQLDGILIRQIRSVLTKRFPSASPQELEAVIGDWKLGYDLYLSELQRSTDGGDAAGRWREFFQRHSNLISEWTRRINDLVDESLVGKFGARVVSALQASRHTRHDDLPSGDAEMLAKLAKKFAAIPEQKEQKDRQNPSRDNPGRKPKITECVGCKAKVVGNHVDFFKTHNPKCPKKRN